MPGTVTCSPGSRARPKRSASGTDATRHTTDSSELTPQNRGIITLREPGTLQHVVVPRRARWVDAPCIGRSFVPGALVYRGVAYEAVAFASGFRNPPEGENARRADRMQTPSPNGAWQPHRSAPPAGMAIVGGSRSEDSCHNCRDLPRPTTLDSELHRGNPSTHRGTRTARRAETRWA